MVPIPSTSAIDRAESITRCAASTRYSTVNFLRPVDITTSLPQPLNGCPVDVYFRWGTSYRPDLRAQFRAGLQKSACKPRYNWSYLVA